MAWVGRERRRCTYLCPLDDAPPPAVLNPPSTPTSPNPDHTHTHTPNHDQSVHVPGLGFFTILKNKREPQFSTPQFVAAANWDAIPGLKLNRSISKGGCIA